MNMIAEGMAYLANELETAVPTKISYRQGNVELTDVPMTLDVIDPDLQTDDPHFSLETTYVHFLVKPDNLALGERILPRQGDEIRYESNGLTAQFVVQNPIGQPVWEWVDATRFLMRVHAIQIREDVNA